MEWVAIWLMCGVIAGFFGYHKGVGFGGFIVGVILGPIGIILVLMSVGNRVRCRFCRQYIDPNSASCQYCHTENPVRRHHNKKK